MIWTEEKRSVIEVSGLRPDSDVLTACRQHDRDLDLIWNIDDNQWEIYRIKRKGVTPSDDLLHWQLSAPATGNFLSMSIVDFIKRHDRSNGGLWDQDDIRKRWVENTKTQLLKNKETKQKKKQDMYYSWKGLIEDFGSQKTTVAVPMKVGYNTATGKNVYAVKKRNKIAERIIRGH